MSEPDLSLERQIPIYAVMPNQQGDIHVKVEVALPRRSARGRHERRRNRASSVPPAAGFHSALFLMWMMAHVLVRLAFTPTARASPIDYVNYTQCMHRLEEQTVPARFEEFGLPTGQLGAFNTTTVGEYLNITDSTADDLAFSEDEASRYCYTFGPHPFHAVSMQASVKKGGCFSFGVGYWRKDNTNAQPVRVMIDGRPIQPPVGICFTDRSRENSMELQFGYFNVPNGGDFEVIIYLSSRYCVGELLLVLPPEKHQDDCPKIVQSLVDIKRTGYRKMVIEDVSHKPRLISVNLDQLLRDPYEFLVDANSTEVPSADGVSLIGVAGFDLTTIPANDTRLVSEEERITINTRVEHEWHEKVHHDHHDKHHSHRHGLDSTISLFIITVCVLIFVVLLLLIKKSNWENFCSGCRGRTTETPDSNTEGQENNQNEQIADGANDTDEEVIDDPLADNYDPAEFITPIPSDTEFPDALTFVATDGCYSKKPRKFRPCSIQNCSLCERRSILRRHSATWVDYFCPINESYVAVQQALERFGLAHQIASQYSAHPLDANDGSRTGGYIIPEIVVESCDDIPFVGLTVVDSGRLTPPSGEDDTLPGIDNPAFDMDQDGNRDPRLDSALDDEECGIPAAEVLRLLNERNPFGQATEEVGPETPMAGNDAPTESKNPFVGQQAQDEAATAGIEMVDMKAAPDKKEGKDKDMEMTPLREPATEGAGVDKGAGDAPIGGMEG